MSTAEQIIAEHLPDNRDIERQVGNCSCTCGWEGWGDTDAEKTAVFAAHVVAALTNAGKVVIDVPSVAYKGELDTDASAFRQVAENLDRNLYAGGSNVRRAVSALLRNVAAALTDDRRTTSEIRTAAARVAEGGER